MYQLAQNSMDTIPYVMHISIIRKVKSLIDKIEKRIEDNCSNDFHSILVMVDAAQQRRFLNMYSNRKFVYAYFIANQDILQEIINYNENKLLKFFERIINLYKNEKY